MLQVEKEKEQETEGAEHDALGATSAGEAVCVYSSSSLEAEAGASQIQGHPWLREILFRTTNFKI